MKLGVGFWSGANVGDPSALVARLKAIGVEGCGMVPEGDYTPEQITALRSSFAAADLFLGEYTMYGAGWPLASESAAARRDGLAHIHRHLQHCADLDVHCLGLSVITDDPGDLWADEVWTRLVGGFAMLMPEAERLGVDITLHPGNRGPLDSPSQLRRLLDQVASPRLKVMLDPVNMTNHRVVRNYTDFLNYCFDEVGDSIIGAHAKDVRFDDTHWVTKIDEMPPGTGLIDYEVYLQRLDALDADIIFTIEHLRDIGVSGTVASPVFHYFGTDHELTRARNYIHEVAGRIGIEIG